MKISQNQANVRDGVKGANTGETKGQQQFSISCTCDKISHLLRPCCLHPFLHRLASFSLLYFFLRKIHAWLTFHCCCLPCPLFELPRSFHSASLFFLFNSKIRSLLYLLFFFRVNCVQLKFWVFFFAKFHCLARDCAMREREKSCKFTLHSSDFRRWWTSTAGTFEKFIKSLSNWMKIMKMWRHSPARMLHQRKPLSTVE